MSVTSNAARNIPRDEIKKERLTGSSGALVAISITAVPERRHQLFKVMWSYSGVPTGGRLYVEDGSGGPVLFDIDIIAGGPGGFELSGLIGSANTALVINLVGVGGVVGKLNLEYQTRM